MPKLEKRSASTKQASNLDTNLFTREEGSGNFATQDLCQQNVVNVIIPLCTATRVDVKMIAQHTSFFGLSQAI